MKSMIAPLSALFYCLLAGGLGTVLAQSKNGFDLDGALVPPAQVLHGGPPVDGIPALDQPRFVPAGGAHGLDDDALVLGLHRHGEARAYPLAIMNWHEVVNDTIGGEAVVITYCPLCGSGMAFEARVDGQPYVFGVSGLLYNSDVLLYDRKTRSLWSQLGMMAISGPMKGATLKSVPLFHGTWRVWRQRHPHSRVLSRETGFARDYDRDPYAGYTQSDELYFSVAHRDRRFHPKTLTLGVVVDGRARAWPFSELAKTKSPLRDRIAGRHVIVTFDLDNSVAELAAADGGKLSFTLAYWFAWYAFHPQTEVYRAGRP